MPTKPLPVLTAYQQFRERWIDCTTCELCECRTKVVLARGRIPAEILFVGEAPGSSEDDVGIPFVPGAPAGRLLETIIDRSLGAENRLRATKGIPILRHCFTNLVCCIPKINGEKSEPDDDHIQSCSPRLIEFVELVEPELIVCVGAQARDWLDPGYRHSVKLERQVPMVSIDHPSYILRANVANKSFLIQKACVIIANAVMDL